MSNEEKVYNLLPSKLTVVTDAMIKEDESLKAFQDSRAAWKVDESLKASIAAKGVLFPVLAVKHNKQVIVVDGKQRVKAARELEESGQQMFVPVLVRDYDEGMIASVRVIANNLRQDNDFLTNLNEAKKLKEVYNFSFEQIGALFGKTHQTIRDWLVIDEMGVSQVKTAVQKGMLGHTAAAKLARGNKNEDGTYNKEAITSQLNDLVSEAKASGDKKIKVDKVAKKTGGTEKPSNAQLRILAAQEETPEEFRFFFRYITGELDLKTMKSVARGKLDWFHLPTVTKEEKKKAKANNATAKKEAKAAKKKATTVTDADVAELFG